MQGALLCVFRGLVVGKRGEGRVRRRRIPTEDFCACFSVVCLVCVLHGLYRDIRIERSFGRKAVGERGEKTRSKEVGEEREGVGE